MDPMGKEQNPSWSQVGIIGTLDSDYCNFKLKAINK